LEKYWKKIGKNLRGFTRGLPPDWDRDISLLAPSCLAGLDK
jgi:hypothetical protein|tara:strand:- start:428 stop:550 length:123 start_codon:yes stop_codon:yes gene_type:complete